MTNPELHRETPVVLPEEEVAPAEDEGALLGKVLQIKAGWDAQKHDDFIFAVSEKDLALKATYGTKEVENYLLWHILTGSTPNPENPPKYFDFPVEEDSIINFFEDHEANS